MTLRGVTPGAQSFDSMLHAARSSAPWACTTIWVEYAPAVSAFLTARGSREPDDLTSEVFLAVFDRLPEFVGGETEFRSFVFSIAYRRLVDELRMRARRRDAVEWSAETDPRSTSSAEDDALTRLGEASALRLLEALPEDQRNVMLLRIVADLTVEQVAAVLDKRAGAVKALQRRALDSMRKKFAPTRTLSAAPDDSEE